MVTKDPRIDAYIAKAAPFARPILARARKLVHQACPEVVETLKWGAPAFEHHGLLCITAAFKKHVAFVLWKHKLLAKGDPRTGALLERLGKLASLDELPPAGALAGCIKKAAKLNRDGIKSPRARRAARPPPAVPIELAAALSRNRRARATFEGFSPSQQREYTEWISGAKGEDTRLRRLEQALEWLAEGKTRHWKYQKC